MSELDLDYLDKLAREQGSLTVSTCLELIAAARELRELKSALEFLCEHEGLVGAYHLRKPERLLARATELGWDPKGTK